jgi:hypothetical protein
MKIKQRLILCVVACSLVQPVFGQTTFGNRDCGVWINRKKNNFSELGATSWLNGYMSGLNVMHKLNGHKDNPLDKVNSVDQIHLWMDNYCQKNPLSNVSDGGDALFVELMTRR